MQKAIDARFENRNSFAEKNPRTYMNFKELPLLLPDPIPKHPRLKDRDFVIYWSRERLKKRDFVILDTETTGLGDKDEIVQIGIIDCHGNELINSLVKPEKNRRMPKEAQEIHGITMKMLENAPTFYELVPHIRKAVGWRQVVCYNNQFDMRMILQTAHKYKLLERGRQLKLRSQCAMIGYSQFIGEKAKFKEDYLWQKLPRPDGFEKHSALDDCHLTLKLIHDMANTMRRNDPPDFDWVSNPLYPWWHMWKWFG